jgi:RNA-binding protein
MLTGKQRRFLRAMGSGLDPILQIGKGGVTDTVAQQLDEALEARELVKVKVLNNCLMDVEEVADALEAMTGSYVAQKIGHNILFYRRSEKKPQIELPG